MAIIEILAAGLLGAGLVSMIKENRKKAAEEERRVNARCKFSDGISRDEFTSIAMKTAKQIKRIKEIEVKDTILRGTVMSQSNLTKWSFSIDFNDYGHITGKYWVETENDDSTIPNVLGDRISEEISMRLE